MQPRFFGVAVFLTSSLFRLDALPAAEEQREALGSPLVVLTGDDSHVFKLAYLRVETDADWTKVWLRHLNMEIDTIHRAAMEVDFDRCMVIAVFGGQSFNSRGFRVHSVEEREDAIVVRLNGISFQTAGGDGGAVRVSPYAFIVLPRSEKPVMLEVNVQNLLAHPPVWKEVAQLPTPMK